MAIKSKSAVLVMLGERLRDHRLSQNLSQKMLSDRSGVAYSTLRKIESTGKGAMDDYVAVLMSLGLVDQLDQFLPVPQTNPELVFKANSKVRQRASGSR